MRGGGEYGEEWHLVGKMVTKHNTWRDFIAAGEYLIDRGYASAAHLAGEGGSAGGITIGRAFTDRPDLFAAAIDVVGISDTLGVENSPNDPPNIVEFGRATTDGGFKGLYEMSAYHHLKDGTRYPAVMVVTGINDPRVAPWEPAKRPDSRLLHPTASRYYCASTMRPDTVLERPKRRRRIFSLTNGVSCSGNSVCGIFSRRVDRVPSRSE